MAVSQLGDVYRLSGDFDFGALGDTGLVADESALSMLSSLSASFEMLFDRQSLFLQTMTFVYGGAVPQVGDFNATLDDPLEQARARVLAAVAAALDAQP